ncbi:hypothetical protein GCM10028798_12910 [Humibacter antri]
MSSHRKYSRRRLSLLTAAAVLLLAGAGTTSAWAIWGNPAPPQPPASAATPTRTPTTTPTPTSPAAPRPPATVGPILPASLPTHLSVPAIGVDTALIQLGQNTDGTVQVPPLTANSPAGWYQKSPTPGQVGPAVILGHVDTPAGRSVFYNLGKLRQGDQISVTRADNTVAVFTIDKVAEYPKNAFPQFAVYGNTNNAQLRLITCGGAYNEAIEHYVDNIVVYASLTASHPV